MEDIEQKEDDLSNDEPAEPAETKTEPPPKEEPKREFTTEEKLARVARLKQRYEKELGIEPAVEVKASQVKTGELSDTQIDLLELKGITESEDIKVVQDVMRKTGQSLREVLKDDYVSTKLSANKQQREVAAATPSSTKRSGQTQIDDIGYWLAENERSGKLPEDFELRVKVIEAKERKYGDNSPTWRRN